MSRRIPTLVLAVLAVMVPATLVGQGFELPPIPLETFTLDNGLTVIVSEDHSAPVVAVNMVYDVGSAHEDMGRSGFAHLFEHMLFEETENLTDGELARLVTQAGGARNGTTDKDRTLYYEVLPSNRVNLSFWLHAERMDRLVVSQRGFDNQREVVKEERRLRIDNQPYGQAQLTLDTLSTDYPPYKHTTIGSMMDLDAAEVGDVLSFYERYYVPNNATLVVVGDVTVPQIRELAEEYFGAIPAGQDVAPLTDFPATPRTDGERRVEVMDPLAQLPLIFMTFNVPPTNAADHYALSVLSDVFSSGESSRLHQRLVKKEQVAPVVISGLNEQVGPGTFLFGSLPNQGGDVEVIQSLIEEEIALLQSEGITQRELDKALNQRRSQAVASRMTVLAKSNLIQWYRVHYGDAARINEDFGNFESVTPEDVMRVANTYLVPENRTIVIARPGAASALGIIP